MSPLHHILCNQRRGRTGNVRQVGTMEPSRQHHHQRNPSLDNSPACRGCFGGKELLLIGLMTVSALVLVNKTVWWW